MNQEMQEQRQYDDLLWRQLKTLPAFRALLRAVEARFYQKIDLPQPVLDVGCGDGHFAQMAFDERPQVGIDPWWGPLQKAVKGAVYGLPLQAMGDNLPFPDDCFASGFSNSVLEHIENIQPVLNEVCRVLQPGAPFVITVPSHCFSEFLGGAAFFDRLGLDSAAERYRNLFNRISRHAHTDPPEVWADRLAEAGFKIERWQYYFSRQALRALEIGHVQGVPSAVTHALTGHWIIGPYESNLRWTERWVRPFYEEEFPAEGAYIFFVARKASGGPIQAALPEARPFALADFATSEKMLLDREELELEGQLALASSPELAVPSPEGGVERATAAASAAGMRRQSAETGGVEKRRRRRWLYLLGLFLALLAPGLASVGGLRLPWLAIFTWLAGTAVGFYALYDPSVRKQSLRVSYFTLVTSLLLFFAAWALRLYDLRGHPFILNGTETSVGLDVLRTINGTISNPFSNGWLTNPTLPLFLMALPIKILGPSALSLRLLSPFVGALTVVITFLFGQRLFGRAAGLAAGLLLLGSYFHLHFSRLGLTNVWDALLVLLALGFVAMAWQKDAEGSRLAWLLAGASTGLGFYLLTSSHLLPIMMLALLLWALLLDRQTLHRQWPNVLAMAGLALLVALPQMLHYAGNPGIFMERVNALGILDSQSGWLGREAMQTGMSELQVMGQQLWASALAFHATLDTSTSFGPPKPLLNFVSGVLVLIGGGISLLRLRRMKYIMLLIWVGVTVIFAGALLVSPPNSQRYIVAAPAVSMLAGIGLAAVVDVLFKGSEEEGRAHYETMSQRKRLLLLMIPVVAAAMMALYDVGFYFGPYRQEHHFGDRNTEIADRLGHYLSSLEGNWSAYFYGPPSMYVDFPTIPFLASDFEKGTNLFDVLNDQEDPAFADAANLVLIFLPERLDELEEVRLNHPGGEEMRFDGYYAEPLFVVYEVREAPRLED